MTGDMMAAAAAPRWMYWTPEGPYADRSLGGLLLRIATHRRTSIEALTVAVVRGRAVVSERRPAVVQLLLEFDVQQPRAVEVAMAEEILRVRALLHRAEAARDLLYEQVLDGLHWARGRMLHWQRLVDQEPTV